MGNYCILTCYHYSKVNLLQRGASHHPLDSGARPPTGEGEGCQTRSARQLWCVLRSIVLIQHISIHAPYRALHGSGLIPAASFVAKSAQLAWFPRSIGKARWFSSLPRVTRGVLIGCEAKQTFRRHRYSLLARRASLLVHRDFVPYLNL